MPRKYKRKAPERILVSEDIIQEAKKLIAKGKSKRFAADYVGINEATLRKRLMSKNVPISLGRFKPTFDQDQEAQLVQYCKTMDEIFYGVTINDLRRLAYEFATANKIEHRFNDSLHMAGRDWVESFIKRHDHLRLRQSAPISLARAIGFNRVQVEKFYTNLKSLYDKYNFRPNRIFNMDETGISTVPKKTPKVVSVKGKKTVGKIVSAERGTTVTVVMCMSAIGLFVPPAFIYPRKRIKSELIEGGPVESICMVSDSGFVNTNLFVKWLYHFNCFVGPSSDDPVLLIIDNHSSHISLEGTNYAREHNIVILTLPPHGSHKLQPLDVAVHSPLKTKYSIECERWMNLHPGRGITQYQVASLFNTAYKHVATISNAEAGFKATGIYPFADDLFNETDFAPSSVTDKLPCSHNDEEKVTNEEDSNIDDVKKTNIIRKENWRDEENAASTVAVTVAQLNPLPRMIGKKKRKQCLKSEVITSSPYKNQLEEKQQIEEQKKRKQAKITQVISSPFEPSPGPSGIKKKQSKRTQITKNKNKKKGTNKSHVCLICDEKYEEPPTEDWIQCIICESWFHENCTAYEKGIFRCDFCN